MTDAIIAEKEPCAVEVKAGKRYFWCACGRSAKQPFCDGSHKGTGIAPVMWKAERDEEVYFCACKQTGDKPLCDGTHETL